MTTCNRCHRGLKDPVSVKAGLGPICRTKTGRGDNDMATNNERTVADMPFDPTTMDITCHRRGSRMAEGGYTTHFNISQTVTHHSPSGFEWGYGGSGPADFALNILALFLPLAGEQECDSCAGYGHFMEDGEPTEDKRERKCLDCTGTGKVPAQGVKCFDGRCSEAAWSLHQDFKREFIARLPEEGGTIHGAEIRRWITEQLAEMSPPCVTRNDGTEGGAA